MCVCVCVCVCVWRRGGMCVSEWMFVRECEEGGMCVCMCG